MRKIHRVLRLFFEAGLSIRAIARSIQASPSTVGDYIRRAHTAGLSWPLPEKLDERALEARLFPIAQVSPRVERAIPDWAQVHAERRHKNVTLALLWHEYKAEHPEGLQYSQFCERYRAWRQRLDVVMRQTPCCFSHSLVGSPRELVGVFRRRISWDDGVMREPAGAGDVAFPMNRYCRSGENVDARAPSVGKGWASAAHLSMPCPHGP